MAIDINVGQTITRTVTAFDAQGVPDPNAVISVTEDSGGSVLALSNQTTTNPGTVTVDYRGVAAGSATVTGTATDPDGNVVSGTDGVTVSAPPPPSTDATSVVFS